MALGAEPVGPGGCPQPGVPQQLAQDSFPGALRRHWKGTSGMNEQGDGQTLPWSQSLAGWQDGQGQDHGIAGRSFREGTREWILEGSEELPMDTGLGEPATGCCWSMGKTGLFFSSKLLELARQGEIMQNILQKDPCP